MVRDAIGSLDFLKITVAAVITNLGKPKGFSINGFPQFHMSKLPETSDIRQLLLQLSDLAFLFFSMFSIGCL